MLPAALRFWPCQAQPGPFDFGRVCSQKAPMADFSANTAAFSRKKAHFLAVLAVKWALYAF